MKSALQKPAIEIQNARKVVVPVRYTAGGEAVHTTSTLLSEEGIHVRSIHPPSVGAKIDLKLYLRRPAMTIVRTAVVSQITPTGFWAEFKDNDSFARVHGSDAARNTLGAAMEPSPRYPTELRIRVFDAEGGEQEGRLRNVSASGAFVEIASLPAAGSLVSIEVEFPGHMTRELVRAWVAHVSDGTRVGQRGIGVQFIDARAGFRLALDGYLAQLSR